MEQKHNPWTRKFFKDRVIFGKIIINKASGLNVLANRNKKKTTVEPPRNIYVEIGDVRSEAVVNLPIYKSFASTLNSNEQLIPLFTH